MHPVKYMYLITSDLSFKLAILGLMVWLIEFFVETVTEMVEVFQQNTFPARTTLN